ncbi:MAG: hypothetical protein QME51_09270, partial [Planctomycetota bacterium]|nr:hypothetical protein [Planctomycetota bacterium]
LALERSEGIGAEVCVTRELLFFYIRTVPVKIQSCSVFVLTSRKKSITKETNQSVKLVIKERNNYTRDEKLCFVE